jgi:hypothetical protein
MFSESAWKDISTRQNTTTSYSGIWKAGLTIQGTLRLRLSLHLRLSPGRGEKHMVHGVQYVLVVEVVIVSLRPVITGHPLVYAPSKHPALLDRVT